MMVGTISVCAQNGWQLNYKVIVVDLEVVVSFARVFGPCRQQIKALDTVQ